MFTIRRPCNIAGICVALIAPALTPSAMEGQTLKRLKRAVTRSAESATASELDKLVRGKVRCVFDDLDCIRKAEKSGKGAVLTTDEGEILVDEGGNPVTDSKAAGQMAAKDKAVARPGDGAWANYDFQPGDEILLVDDFTDDKVGDFPRRFELVQGSFEIVDLEGERYLRATSSGLLAIPLPRTLPEKFTVETSVNLSHGNAFVRILPGRSYYGPARTYKGSAASVEYTRAGIRPVGAEGPSALMNMGAGSARDAIVAVRIMADGGHLKMYVGERRVANVPNGVFPRGDTLFLAVGSATESNPILVGAMRIAGGGRDLYDRLARDGRVATQGILFATGSDRIRPESTPTLEEIGKMLRDHPELRLAIEGHTDSDGEDGFNQELSQRRAAAVRTYLTTQLGIDGSRLESAGFGESRPVGDNKTAEGKQQNRRVELVRLGG